MQIKVNGEARLFDAPLTVQGLADILGLNPAQVAVEKNRSIVPRGLYAQETIMDGDAIEIVRFIGGG